MKHQFLIGLVAFTLGALLYWQWRLFPTILKARDPKTGQAIALEVSQLIKDNGQLRQQLLELDEQKEKLSSSSTDRAKQQEAVASAINQYKVISGETPVRGPGLTITFSSGLNPVQLVDLVNALRNLGVEAMSINGQRISGKTGLVTQPGQIVVSVIANRELVGESLARRGGILDQIGSQALVIEHDTIELPAK